MKDIELLISSLVEEQFPSFYKEKPSQAEFNKQMRRVAGHEFGG